MLLTVRQKQTAVSLNRARTYGGIAAAARSRAREERLEATDHAGPARLTRIATRLPGAASPQELRRRIARPPASSSDSRRETFLALKSGLTGGTILLGLSSGLGVVPFMGGADARHRRRRDLLHRPRLRT